MSQNPFADDPTTQAEYFEGRWISKGKTYTTRDVSAINDRLASEITRINSRRSLSAEAKQIAIARAYRDARDRITAMKQAETDHITSERTRLSRKLFGFEGNADPQTVIVRRDAADRAAKLDSPEAAARALSMAEANGDAYMAQAIAGQANANMWNDVVNTYLDTHPEAGAAAQQWRELPDPDDGVWKLQQAMTYTVMQPQELGGMPDYQVDRLADTVLDGNAPTAA
ncbi:hypothetical protein HRW23_21980 [Streptomyces lunaelactis]|uniref:hypothetical protein n=1 Tax=Streptomyces lunaelactis TaxID=1535768 RepID=UPI001584D1F5|nr:hypothetical protein [Streptomyces lunaelactis]NUK72109.1 hypothetical protein [Streptomyces lunaelactis]NUK80017.1 hypothetical protein [Streptomyces lunaelactis]